MLHCGIRFRILTRALEWDLNTAESAASGILSVVSYPSLLSVVSYPSILSVVPFTRQSLRWAVVLGVMFLNLGGLDWVLLSQVWIVAGTGWWDLGGGIWVVGSGWW